MRTNESMRDIFRFGVEIISVENGFVILDGNSLMECNPMNQSRKKWIAYSVEALGDLIIQLATSKGTENGK